MIEKDITQIFWREAVSTAIYTLNRVQLKKDSKKTPYEIWYGKTPNVSYFKIFGSQCYVLKDDRNGKIDAKSDEGIFLVYSTKSKAFKFLIKASNKIVESENVKIDEFVEKNELESTKELEDYNKFVYYEGPTTLPGQQCLNPEQQNVATDG